MTENPYAPPDARVTDSYVDVRARGGWWNARVLATRFASANAIVVSASILYEGFIVDHSQDSDQDPWYEILQMALFFGVGAIQK